MAEPPAPRRRTRGLIAAAVLVGLLVVVVFAQRRSNDRTAPFPPASLGAAVHLTVVPAAEAQHRVDQLAGAGRLNAVTTQSDSVIVGQVTFANPGKARTPGQYALIVIDNDLHTPVLGMRGIGPVGTNVGQGWDGRYDAVVRSLNASIGTRDPMAVLLPPGTHGPITFEATLDPSALPITKPSVQLTVALAFFATDGHLYWVHALPT